MFGRVVRTGGTGIFTSIPVQGAGMEEKTAPNIAIKVIVIVAGLGTEDFSSSFTQTWGKRARRSGQVVCRFWGDRRLLS